MRPRPGGVVNGDGAVGMDSTDAPAIPIAHPPAASGDKAAVVAAGDDLVADRGVLVPGGTMVHSTSPARTRAAWQPHRKFAIVCNPRYLGRHVFGRQRRHEQLV